MPPPGLLRAGIAGAGLMGRWHASAIRRAGGRVVAVADTNTVNAGRLAHACGKAQTFADGGRMLESVDLDVVHICSPAETHSAITTQAIHTGRHVMVEKPLAPTTRDTECLYALAEERGVLLCPVHQFIFQRGVSDAIARLSEIGRVVDMQMTFCSAGGAPFGPSHLDLIAGDILPHPLSLVYRIFPGAMDGEWMIRRIGNGELRVFRDFSGTSFSILISMNARPTSATMTLTGAAGTIHADLFHGFSFLEPGDVSKLRKIAHPFELGTRLLWSATTNLAKRTAQWEPAYPGLARLVELFYNSIRSGNPPPISAAEAVAVARARDQMLEVISAEAVRQSQ